MKVYECQSICLFGNLVFFPSALFSIPFPSLCATVPPSFPYSILHAVNTPHQFSVLKSSDYALSNINPVLYQQLQRRPEIVDIDNHLSR